MRGRALIALARTHAFPERSRGRGALRDCLASSAPGHHRRHPSRQHGLVGRVRRDARGWRGDPQANRRDPDARADRIGAVTTVLTVEGEEALRRLNALAAFYSSSTQTYALDSPGRLSSGRRASSGRRTLLGDGHRPLRDCNRGVPDRPRQAPGERSPQGGACGKPSASDPRGASSRFTNRGTRSRQVGRPHQPLVGRSRRRHPAGLRRVQPASGTACNQARDCASLRRDHGAVPQASPTASRQGGLPRSATSDRARPDQRNGRT